MGDACGLVLVSKDSCGPIDAPHTPPSCPAKAGHPIFTISLVSTGSPAFAGDDSRVVRTFQTSRASLNRPDLDHLGHVVLQQILDAVPQRRCGRRATRAGA